MLFYISTFLFLLCCPTITITELHRMCYEINSNCDSSDTVVYWSWAFTAPSFTCLHGAMSLKASVFWVQHPFIYIAQTNEYVNLMFYALTVSSQDRRWEIDRWLVWIYWPHSSSTYIEEDRWHFPDEYLWPESICDFCFHTQTLTLR